MNWYRSKTAFIGLKRLATLPEEDKQACIDAYKFFQRMQAGEKTETADETNAVADYYKVVNNMLSIFDLEKLYIPLLLNESEGLYGNQLLCEQAVLKELNLRDPASSHLLDMGCGRGGISHYFATLTGGRVSGYNIDPNQIENAIGWSAECGMSDRLHFKIGDHHAPLEYESNTFDGCFSFQAVWPFFKKEELYAHAREMYRVVKPGSRYACSEYLLTPHFDWANDEHVALHKRFLPTLAATQSMYPADVCAALERAGFKILVSAPSKSEAWPLCEQKRNLALRNLCHQRNLRISFVLLRLIVSHFRSAPFLPAERVFLARVSPAVLVDHVRCDVQGCRSQRGDKRRRRSRSQINRNQGVSDAALLGLCRH